MNLLSTIGMTTEMQPSARDELAVLRSFCGSEREYLDMIWSMRGARTKARHSHKHAWPFQRVTDTKIVSAISLAVARKSRNRKV